MTCQSAKQPGSAVMDFFKLHGISSARTPTRSIANQPSADADALQAHEFTFRADASGHVAGFTTTCSPTSGAACPPLMLPSTSSTGEATFGAEVPVGLHVAKSPCHKLGEAQLADVLPLPCGPDRLQGLTRSQLLFTLATRIDPRSLNIGRDKEYFIFMELRAKHQWATFRMTSKDYVKATELYNDTLEADCRTRGLPLPAKKNPRAIMDHLNKIEIEVLDRNARQDFACMCFLSVSCSPVSEDSLTRFLLLSKTIKANGVLDAALRSRRAGQAVSKEVQGASVLPGCCRCTPRLSH